MQTPDMFTRDFQEAARLEAEMAHGRQRNVQIFAEMFLSLGADCIKIAGTRHDAELLEARGLAAARWNQLIGIEAQIPRDEARLAVRERGRVPDPTDEFAPKELLAKKDAEYRDRIEGDRAALKELKEQARRERKELESFVTTRR